jgi:hypothetical protein
MTTYLCGPINGCTDSECKDWRELAKQRLSKTIDPMRRDYRGVEGNNAKDIVEGDKVDIDASNVLLVWFPKPSVGTCMEILYAWERGKYVVVVVPPGISISPWLTYHSHLITESWDDAIVFIKSREF